MFIPYVFIAQLSPVALLVRVITANLCSTVALCVLVITATSFSTVVLHVLLILVTLLFRLFL